MVVLLIAVIPLVMLSRRMRVPYPIVLVIGGIVLGFIPGLPPIRLPPDVVLVVFLPPLLYWEAITTSLRDIRMNAGLIRTLVVGLVILTTTAVALVAHALITGLPWASAFVLGAIVAPTDAVAFAVVAKRLRLPRTTTAIVAAESLLNDATALVLYAAAIAAAVSGTFVLRNVILAFVVSSGGAIALGILVGLGVKFAWRAVRDSELQMAVSVLAPFVAYLPAYRLGLSGVLAVVAAGLVINRAASQTLSAQTRERSAGFWETIAFLMNALIFVLIGLQLHPILDALRPYALGRLIVAAIVISATVIAARLGWLFAQRYVLRFPYRFAGSDEEDLKERLVAGWSGFRGGVSLAAALAIPTTIMSGAPFPGRGLAIFLTFGVICVTLIGQGLTLPGLVRRLALEQHDDAADALRGTVARMSRAALTRLHALEREQQTSSAAIELLRRRYEGRVKRSDGVPDGYDVAARALLETQRAELLALRAREGIDGEVVSRVEALLDIEELELNRLQALDAAPPQTPG